MDIRPIRNQRDHAQALREVERLWGARSGTPEADKPTPPRRLSRSGSQETQEATPRKVGAILILPWQEFLERLWSDAFVG
jgi:HTH-type transcriptional regulator/antitoxin HigA